jgi:hypothetical protein
VIHDIHSFGGFNHLQLSEYIIQSFNNGISVTRVLSQYKYSNFGNNGISVTCVVKQDKYSNFGKTGIFVTRVS